MLCRYSVVQDTVYKMVLVPSQYEVTSYLVSSRYFLHELHWLPIREHVKFKLACLVRQSLFVQAPPYLADNCCLVSNSTQRSLRSVDVPACVVP